MNKKSITKRYLLFALSVVVFLGTTTPNSVKAQAAEISAVHVQPNVETASERIVKNKPQALQLDNTIVSMTEKRTLHASFKLPKEVDVKSINWTYDGKPLSQWQKYKDGSYSGPSFISVDNLTVNEGIVHANITFDLPYDTENLAEGGLLQRSPYKSLMGAFNLAAQANGQVIAQAPVKLTPYESYYSYDELKSQIDSITLLAAQKNHRYIKTMSIGKSVEGRDIYFTILAKDQATVEKYQNETCPSMLNNPQKLQEDIKSGSVSDYKVPIWLNNIHPHEAPGVSAILNFFKAMALEEQLTYNTNASKAEPNNVTLDIDAALEQVFFLLVYTDNPDGLVHTTRNNADDFDLNRDNSYQTQPETQSVAEQIAKWSPISFLDMHGFDSDFLIDPTTPPHSPNVEYDLLIDHMLEQGKAMGEAGIGNTKYENYYIPYEEYQKSVENPDYVTKGSTSGWDDASAAFAAVFAMHHGAMGHTLEIPEMNEESTKALFYSAVAATNYVVGKKEELFLNQLKFYERGVNNIDDAAVDRYFVNAKNVEVGRPRQHNQNFFPEYYVLPIDHTMQKNSLEVYRMIDYLLRNGIKVECSTADVTVNETTYPAGSFVINMHQAKHGIANLVLYDGVDVSDFESIAAEMIQNFADLRGFDRYIVRKVAAFEYKTSAITSVSIPVTQVPDRFAYVLLQNTNNDAIKAVNRLLSEGKTVTMLTQSGSGYEAGDFVICYKDLIPLASEYYLDVKEFSNTMPNGKVLKPSTIAAVGETAYVLKELGFEITQDQLKADVLVNTFDSSTFVNEGKPYIAYGNMGMGNVQDWIPEFNYEGPEWERYEGLFLTNVTQDHVITAAYNKQEYFYTITGSYITHIPKTAKALISISASDDFFKAGWWPGHNAAKGKIMAFTYNENNKHLTVFANDLINDNHTQHQFRLLANSIFDAEPN